MKAKSLLNAQLGKGKAWGNLQRVEMCQKAEEC